MVRWPFGLPNLRVSLASSHFPQRSSDENVKKEIAWAWQQVSVEGRRVDSTGQWGSIIGGRGWSLSCGAGPVAACLLCDHFGRTKGDGIDDHPITIGYLICANPMHPPKNP